jgi:hypothetical protein
VRHLPTGLSALGLAMIATFGVLLPGTAVAQSTTPTFVQGMAFSTVPSSTTTVTLGGQVSQGDLLVGWFSQYHTSTPEEIQVSDNVNGTWTRAPSSLTFEDDTGDIALYYRENSQAAPSGLVITLSVSSAVYWQGVVADYSGVALAGALDQIVSQRFADGSSVDTGPTAPVDAGELVFAALITSPSNGSVTPGSSQGVPYAARAQTDNGSAYEEDITSSAAGGQDGTATLSFLTDWYAVCAVFHPYPATPPVPPSTPTGLEATSVASTRVTLSWSPSSTGSVAGYTVYRDGSAIETTGPDTTIFVDGDVTPSTTYTYTVDAFDLANDHSAPSSPLTVTTPVASPEFVQGAAASTGTHVSSYTLTLPEPVLTGDLLVGWFSQFGASGQVQVSDNVNGPWTRSVSTTWGGSGDIALFYRQKSAPAPAGLTIKVAGAAPAYLQEVAAHYRNVAQVGALDQAVVSGGQGTDVSAGPTAPVPAGELVVAAVLTSSEPVFATPGSSQTVPYVLDVRNGSASTDLEDILSSAAGPQQGSLTLGTPDTWQMLLATFRTIGTASSTTGVTSSVNPSVSGQPVTFTATVKAGTAGVGTPTGTVTFKDGANTLGTGALNSTGQAKFTISKLAVGSHPITASYGGDAKFSGSTSSTLNQTVKKASTTTLVSSSANPSVSGQPVTFTATVTAKSPGTGIPTGTVTFKDGANTLGTGTLDSSGHAMFVTSPLAVASHSITASYGGDANFNGSISTTLNQTVKKAATTTLVSSSANPSVFGQSVTFTATVTANSPGAGTPTGAVTFKDGGSTLGTGTLNNSGQAIFTTSTLKVGSHSITASYGGDAHFNGSTSSTLTQTTTTTTPTTSTTSSTTSTQPPTTTTTLAPTTTTTTEPPPTSTTSTQPPDTTTTLPPTTTSTTEPPTTSTTSSTSTTEPPTTTSEPPATTTTEPPTTSTTQTVNPG